MTRRILLIGATGSFGRRLAGHLAGVAGIALVVASRSAQRAEALRDELVAASPLAHITARAFDRDGCAHAQILALDPWLVIDASGPFQSCGYAMAEAALSAGAHWIDLADARDYILGFGSALDRLARAKGLTALAGASSTPALSTATIEELTKNWRRVDTVDIAILPGGGGTVGLSVIRSILSYAGAPVPVWLEGRAQTTRGWGCAKRLSIPGLAPRYVSPVDTADAVLLPERFAVSSRVRFFAGLESRLEHFGLCILASLKARGVIADLRPLARVLHRARGITARFCNDRGGMSVDVSGLDSDGHAASARWLLLAEKGEGPHVPVLPALAFTRALLVGEIGAGARPACGVLALAAFEAEMHPLALRTRRVHVTQNKDGLFAAACGPESYAALHPALQQFHDGDAPVVWAGHADIETGSGILAGLVRCMFGFPKRGTNVPVTVTVERKGGRETWTRNFAGARFCSELSQEGQGVISERFGRFCILLRLEINSGDLLMPVSGWRFGRLPLPGALAPRSDTREYQDERGRFCFDVRVSAPLIGLIAHYRGYLIQRKAECGT